MDYRKISEELKELLEMEGSPVAVRLVKNEEISGEKLEKKRHCEFIQDARLRGACGYATADEHLCRGGAAVLGLCRVPPQVADGSLYHKLGNYSTLEAAAETVEAVPAVKGEYHASVYAPLEEADFEPDAVVFILKPAQALRLSQAYLHYRGGRISGDYSGIQSLCADAVAAVRERGIPNMTMGCNGSRKYAGIRPEELAVGVPASDLEGIVEALRKFREKWG